MSFLRHREIYPCDEGASLRSRPRSSPWMSLQLGILAGCSPAEPASASPSWSHAGKYQPRRAMLRQRTAQCRLTGCLSQGVQSNLRLDQLSLFLSARIYSVASKHIDFEADVDVVGQGKDDMIVGHGQQLCLSECGETFLVIPARRTAW
jgi:hypothetical protein